MNSKERVMAAFNHEEPDRVPCWCGSSPEFWSKAKKQLDLDDEGLRERFCDDFRRVEADYAGPVFACSDGAVSRTVFGIERHGMGYGQPMGHPLASAGIKEVNEYPWPDPDWIDVSSVRSKADAYNGRYAILGGDWSPFWHDAIDLFGMENMFLKMYDDPGLIDAVMEHVVDYYHEVNRRMFDAAASSIDVMFIGNDLGGQTGPLLGVGLLERFILPQLKRLIDLGHDYGLKVQMHCCGGIAPLIPSLIHAGLDGIHAVQTSCSGMDLALLKKEFGNKVLFNGGIDSHHILIDGNPDMVRKNTVEILKTMMPGGGYVAGASHDSILEETPVENILAMFDTVVEFGRYNIGGAR